MSHSLKTPLLFGFPFAIISISFFVYHSLFISAITSFLIQDTQHSSSLVKYQLAIFFRIWSLLCLAPRCSQIHVTLSCSKLPLLDKLKHPKLISTLYPIPYFDLIYRLFKLLHLFHSAFRAYSLPNPRWTDQYNIPPFFQTLPPRKPPNQTDEKSTNQPKLTVEHEGLSVEWKLLAMT